MHPRKGLADRHEGRPESFRDNQMTEDRQRWRRTLAAIAISALAVGGMSALVASPAAADDGTEVVLEETTDVVDEAAAAAAAAAAQAEADAAAAAAQAEAEAAAAAAAQAEAEAAAAAAAAQAEADAAAAAEAAAAAAAQAEADAAAAEVAESAADTGSAQARAAPSDVSLLLVPPPEGEVQEKVEICHATSSHTNPYVINEPNASGDVQGHADHDGPIWFPGIDEDWGDIIPPFTYEDNEGEQFFPGLNWDAEGQAIFANDCMIPDQPPPVLTVVAHACPVVDGTGTVNFAVTGLLANVDYRVTILNAQGQFVDAVEIDGAQGSFNGSFNLPPGNYTIVLDEVNGGVFEITRTQFTIGACPLPPIVPEKVVEKKVVEKVVVKTLAATGAETAEPLMAGGMIMLLLGGAALLAANRRRWGTSHSE